MTRALSRQLRELAHCYGVQTAYYDVAGQRRQASADALLLVLRALGAPVATLQDVTAALREWRLAQWQRPVEPVLVAWDGAPGMVELRLPSERVGGPVACHLRLENGDVYTRSYDLAQLPTLRTVAIEGTSYVVKGLALPDTLPWGYHRLGLEMRGGLCEATLISAPREAYAPPKGRERRAWGVFMPLYALHSRRSWGSGDLADLEALMAWGAGLGGSIVAMLPLLASFLDEPFDASPYAPASRLFWNELYADVARAPELKACPAAQALLESSAVQRGLEGRRSSSLVDYRRQMALKRTVLQELARCFFAQASERMASFQRFLATHPAAEDYARFRATGERRRAPWPAWPQPLRDGVLKEGDYDEEARRYHLYVQWLMHTQLESLAEKAQQKGQQLYFDLPLGVHPDSYDPWREREAFAWGIAAGAPPDPFCTKGQDWGFPPLHPERLREQGYRYYLAYLRHHLRHASLLRLDHIMGLHRLFWVPHGLEPSQGVYVRYPAEEFYAILSLESHRHRALIVGEDLGIVPRYVRTAMARHKVHRMFVLQYELLEPRRPLRPVPSRCAASLNTHDMPSFASFWQGLDIADRRDLGLLDAAGASREQEHRQALRQDLVSYLKREGRLEDPQDASSVLRGCLAHLSASRARVVLVNLEDLWLETEPQNVPGTKEERPNWRRKARYPLETFYQMPPVLEALQEVASRRRRGPGPSEGARPRREPRR